MILRLTVEQFCADYLREKGVPESVRASIMTGLKDEHPQVMGKRWDEDIFGYPTSFTTVMQFVTREYAHSWLTENMPDVWYIAMFE